MNTCPNGFDQTDMVNSLVFLTTCRGTVLPVGVLVSYIGVGVGGRGLAKMLF